MVFSSFPVASARRVAHTFRCFYERALGDRSMLVVNLANGVTIINAHLSSGVDVESSRMETMRFTQIHDIHRQVETALSVSSAVVIAGDFNCSPDASPDNYNFIKSLGWRDAWTESGNEESGCGWTWDAENPLNRRTVHASLPHRCDHVWIAGAGGAAAEAKLAIRDSTSDHYAVLADIVLRRPR